MMKAIVTVRLPRNPDHDPKNKKTGKCPLFKAYSGAFTCTDITGQHHSYIDYGKDLEDIKQKAQARFGHVTRIEELP